ncbi:hypothetical protein NL676_037888 [Syzygium grande]|nr:hypothetical protein NL676_037888 [Syzygium grande]
MVADSSFSLIGSSGAPEKLPKIISLGARLISHVPSDEASLHASLARSDGGCEPSVDAAYRCRQRHELPNTATIEAATSLRVISSIRGRHGYLRLPTATVQRKYQQIVKAYDIQLKTKFELKGRDAQADGAGVVVHRTWLVDGNDNGFFPWARNENGTPSEYQTGRQRSPDV